VGAGPNGFGGRLALNPCPTGSAQRPVGDFDGRRLGTVCARNITDFLTLFPKTERLGLLARGTFDLSATTSAFFDANYSNNKTFQTFSAAFAPTSQIDQSTGLTVTTNIVLPANSRNNPTAANRILQYGFYELGGRDSDIETKAGRFAGGVKGVAGAWDWEVAAGAAKSETTQINYNRVNRFLLTPAFISSYDFSNPSAATAGALRITPTRVATSKLSFADAKVSSEIAQMPAGPVGFAAGIEFRRESLADRPDALITSGAVLGQGGTATDGSRNSNAQFAEVSVPLAKNLEAQVAIRRDDYSDFGSKTSPKVGLKWTPMKELLVRGTWSKGFKAPTLPEVSPSRATFFTTIFDPAIGGFASIAGTVQSNPNLKAESSKAGNVGVVWEPSKDTNFSVDFYRIRLNDTIQAPIQADFNREGRGLSILPNTITRDASGNPLAWSGRYINLDFQETSGIDFEVNHSMPLWDGKFTATLSFNYVSSFYVPEEPGGARTDVVDLNSGDFTSSVPRYKGFVTGTYKKGNWTTAATYRYTHSLDQNAAGTPVRAGATAPEARVGAAYFVDLFAAYEGIKNLRLTANVRNALNRRPPYDPGYGSGIDFTQYDARGRFYTVGATYTFK
jgi:iron complex outermembrane receptor protein